MTEDLKLRLKQFIKNIDEAFELYGDSLIDELILKVGLARVTGNLYGSTKIKTIKENVEKINNKGYYANKLLKDYYRSQLCMFAIDFDIEDEEFYKLEDELNDSFVNEMVNQNLQENKAKYDELCLSKINDLYQDICEQVGEVNV